MNLPKESVDRRTTFGESLGGDAATDDQAADAPHDRAGLTLQRVLATVVQIVLVAVIVLAALGLWERIVDSAPKAERKARERVARLVEVTPATPALTGPVIEAWGDVRPAQTLIVRPEVSGTLVWVHPEITPGGRISAGEVVARFDDRDLVLAVDRADADIAGIRARMLLEDGQAAIGRLELRRLSRNLSAEQRALVLRQPQMAELEAELAAARTVREQALNALARAEVRAPFDALVIAESVAPGAMLAQGAEAATLVAADRFHVALAVPAAALGWLRLDGTQTVTLTQPGTWPDGSWRAGTVARLGSSLTETGRMAELVVEVTDPVPRDGSDRPALLLGSFVRGVLQGPPIPGAIAIDRAHLRDDGTVWVMSADNMLEVRTPEILWRGPEAVLVKGDIRPGERIVTSQLSSFAPGMALRTREGGGT